MKLIFLKIDLQFTKDFEKILPIWKKYSSLQFSFALRVFVDAHKNRPLLWSKDPLFCFEFSNIIKSWFYFSKKQKNPFLQIWHSHRALHTAFFSRVQYWFGGWFLLHSKSFCWNSVCQNFRRIGNPNKSSQLHSSEF